MSSPLVSRKYEGATDTFISLGKFNSLIEAENLVKYIKTKFFRTLLSSKKKTQDNPPEVWSNIPMQDFTSSSDIDWSKSVKQIDEQLYKKYGLTDKEVAFIEEKVQVME